MLHKSPQKRKLVVSRPVAVSGTVRVTCIKEQDFSGKGIHASVADGVHLSVHLASRILPFDTLNGAQEYSSFDTREQN